MGRLEVLKTYKVYIGGKFPRTESGRTFPAKDPKGNVIANMCLSSRKDIREAVVSARKAFGDWSSRAPFNRSQILYRIAEMLEGRQSQFFEELMKQGFSAAKAKEEIELSIDRLVYYSGWCDKYQQIFGTVNPVSSSHFNFSVPEPTGVVGVLTDQSTSLLGLVSLIAPIIAGGNTCVVVPSEKFPLCSITFAEVVNSSDVPGGVINILTGKQEELGPILASHMDVNAMVGSEVDQELWKKLEVEAAGNVKRARKYAANWRSEEAESPYMIMDFQEVKTTWHPIEKIGGAGSGY